MLVEGGGRRTESREPRVESRESRVESAEQRANRQESRVALDTRLFAGTCYLTPNSRTDLEHSEAASANSLLLPLFPQMTDEQQDAVLTALFREKTVGTPPASDGRF